MEIHQLHYFVAVAELGNFTRAAERCFVAQPSLSQQIKKLEQELQCLLLDRSTRKIRLTDSGRSFYKRAVDILSSVEAAKAEVSESVDVGRVAIGVIPTIAPFLLPKVLNQFVQKFPKAEVTIFENLTKYTIQACLEGEVDVGLLALPIDNEKLTTEAIFKEELLLALPENSPLASKKRIRLEDIAEEKFILLNETHCLGEQIIRFCEQHSCLPTISCHSAQLYTVQKLVELGHGISLIPQMAIDEKQSKKIIYKSLTGKKPERTIAMTWHKHRHQSLLVRELIKMLRSEFQKNE